MRNSYSIIQIFKFIVVGISNTLLTALVIWLLFKIFGFSVYFSNIIGYIAGLINSYLWNLKWTFSSNINSKNTLLKFIIVFIISYILQLCNLYILLQFTNIDPYICQLLSIGVYTSINFILNKFYTFKSDVK